MNMLGDGCACDGLIWCLNVCLRGYYLNDFVRLVFECKEVGCKNICCLRFFFAQGLREVGASIV